MVFGHMVKDHSVGEKKPATATSYATLFNCNHQGIFYMYHPTDSTYHGLCYTSSGALAGSRNSSMGPS